MEIIDQMGRKLHFDTFPKRVISLVPSVTEFLIDIGAHVVGRTKFCVHPPSIRNIPIIGGTKKFRFDAIDDLQPDLIIGNKEENYQEGIEILIEKYPVWMSDILTLEHAYDMMSSLGIMLKKEKSSELVSKQVFENLGLFKNVKKGRVIYLIWSDPWMAVGRDTFIDHMLSFVGYSNGIQSTRYPVLSENDLKEFDPAYVLLSSEPFPFKEKHTQIIQKLLPKAKIIPVDGEAYSWYGSRLSKVTF